MSISEDHAHLQQNWQQLVAEVAELSVRSGRAKDAVRIIGVTKYVDAKTTAALIQVGCRDVGENRPQMLWEKAEQIDSSLPVAWHLIGHLQRNKVRRLLRQRVTIHSVDSPRLLAAIAAEAQSQQQRVPVLLEANISGDAAKTGMTIEELYRTVDEIPGDEIIGGGVQVVGLMAMAGLDSDAAAAQAQFAATRELRDELARRCGLELPELSMGMSGDFPQAIAEGATMIRVGTRLFANSHS